MDISHTQGESPTTASTDSVTLRTEHFAFHGTGGEYFRIWIVNLLLTIITLGIYSAWAKVRRMKYLHENTELMGARFGYHADAFKILIGRVVVVAVIGGFYALAHFYPTFSSIGTVVWILALPALLTLALYFRLKNSSYRGLRFAFKGSIAQSYKVMFGPLVVAVLGAIAIAIALYVVEANEEQSKTFILTVVLVLFAIYILFPILVVPFFHVQWKRFAHQHSHFGNVQFGFTATVKQYTKAYAQSIGLWLGGIVVLILVGILVFGFLFLFNGFDDLTNTDKPIASKGTILFITIAVIYALLFTIQPYMKALFFNLAWNNTQIAGQSFRSTLSKWGMVKLSVTNSILTVLTLGFFRPFAVIRTQRYLLENLHLDLEATGIVILNTLDSSNPNATAEGALDLLGNLDM